MSSSNNIPKHIAIIMDGNGRWAKKRNLPRTSGHLAGVKRVEEAIATARELGIKVLTLYTFSTENWTRPQEEVSMLMRTLISVLNRKIRKLNEGNIRFKFIGRKEGVPKVVLEAIASAAEKTKNNTGLIVNIAFNYGGRIEILDAVKGIAVEIEKKKITSHQITEELINRHLYTFGLPDPDLLIRTSGELRISNFLLWQIAYAEIWVTDTLWPDFDKRDLYEAITAFQKRERRYGGLKPKLTYR